MTADKIKEIEQKYDMWADDFNLDPQDIEWLIEQAELYKEALSKTRYAIHTQISTMNHQENTNLERSYMKGILFASKMINRYFNKVVERLEESK